MNPGVLALCDPSHRDSRLDKLYVGICVQSHLYCHITGGRGMALVQCFAVIFSSFHTHSGSSENVQSRPSDTNASTIPRRVVSLTSPPLRNFRNVLYETCLCALSCTKLQRPSIFAVSHCVRRTLRSALEDAGSMGSGANVDLERAADDGVLAFASNLKQTEIDFLKTA